MTTEPEPLPHADDALAGLALPELTRLLMREEDRVPLGLIHECARRGVAMAESLGELLNKDYYWGEDQSEGEWWLLHHAVMILGLIPDARAGLLLVAFMRRIDEARYEALHDVLSGYWPALFTNKPEPVVQALRVLAEDSASDPLVRVEAANAAIAWAARPESPWPLDRALDWAAAIAFRRNENFEVRALVGDTLLGFARPQDRRGLESLAEMKSGSAVYFGRDDITRAYALRGEPPHWEQLTDPWSFYTPEAIAQRQQDLAEADLLADEGEDPGLTGETYVRSVPKVGRNDPCPCGSGKKYKKCCMAQT